MFLYSETFSQVLAMNFHFSLKAAIFENLFMKSLQKTYHQKFCPLKISSYTVSWSYCSYNVIIIIIESNGAENIGHSHFLASWGYYQYLKYAIIITVCMCILETQRATFRIILSMCSMK